MTQVCACVLNPRGSEYKKGFSRLRGLIGPGGEVGTVIWSKLSLARRFVFLLFLEKKLLDRAVNRFKQWLPPLMTDNGSEY